MVSYSEDESGGFDLTLKMPVTVAVGNRSPTLEEMGWTTPY